MSAGNELSLKPESLCRATFQLRSDVGGPPPRPYGTAPTSDISPPDVEERAAGSSGPPEAESRQAESRTAVAEHTTDMHVDLAAPHGIRADEGVMRREERPAAGSDPPQEERAADGALGQGAICREEQSAERRVPLESERRDTGDAKRARSPEPERSGCAECGSGSDHLERGVRCASCGAGRRLPPAEQHSGAASVDLSEGAQPVGLVGPGEEVNGPGGGGVGEPQRQSGEVETKNSADRLCHGPSEPLLGWLQ